MEIVIDNPVPPANWMSRPVNLKSAKPGQPGTALTQNPGPPLCLGKQKPCLEKQSLVWKNRALSGKTESCLEKQSPVWKNRVLSGKTEPCLEKQSPVWKNRALSGKTESC